MPWIGRAGPRAGQSALPMTVTAIQGRAHRRVNPVGPAPTIRTTPFAESSAIASVHANDRWRTMLLLTGIRLPLPAKQMLSRRNPDAQAGRELRRIPRRARPPRYHNVVRANNVFTSI
jgi:hypothetical protein